MKKIILAFALIFLFAIPCQAYSIFRTGFISMGLSTFEADVYGLGDFIIDGDFYGENAILSIDLEAVNANLSGDLETNQVNITGSSGLVFQTLQDTWAFRYASGLGADNTGIFFNAATSALDFRYLDTPWLTSHLLTGGLTLTPVVANTDIPMNFVGTTNSGLYTWMEDEDYFQFLDDVLMDGDLDVMGDFSAATLNGDGSAITNLASALMWSFPGTLYVCTTETEGIYTVVMDAAYTIVKVKAYVSTNPDGADLIIDVDKNGTTIFTTQANRPTIADGTNADDSGTPDVTALAEGDRLGFHIDQVGAEAPGADLSVTVVMTRN